MDVEATVRHLERIANGVKGPLSANEFGGLSVSTDIPRYARLAAAGRLYAFDMHAGTAKAPVVAAPTTSPEWGLYNASPTDTLVVLEAAATLKSGTQGLGIALMGASALGPQTAVTADYTGAIKSCLDGSKRSPDAYLTNNPTLVGGTPAWHVLNNDQGNGIAQVNIGSGIVAREIDGKLIARPNGGMCAFEIVAPTGASALFTVSFVVAMLPLDLY